MRMRKYATLLALVLTLVFLSILTGPCGKYFRPKLADADMIPMVSGLRIGMDPKEVQATLGAPTFAPEGGIWRYRDGTIAAYQAKDHSLSFVIGKSAELFGGPKFVCPVPLNSVLEVMGEPSETVEHFQSSEVVYRTRHGILVATTDERSQIYLFKLVKKYPLRSGQ